jgi:hypothetical protein
MIAHTVVIASFQKLTYGVFSLLLPQDEISIDGLNVYSERGVFVLIYDCCW